MGIFDYDHVLASDSAMECVEKLLGVIYGEDTNFEKIGKMKFVVTMIEDWTVNGKAENRAEQINVCFRHPFEYYDELFKWWTRLRAVDVEAKLSKLVAAANDLWDLCGKGCFGVWYTDCSLHDAKQKVQGSSYLVLALMSMAAGARVPARLKDAFVAAAESELARIKDLGAPPQCDAVTHRENLLAVIRSYDFDDPQYRLFVRECFGPRELSTLARLRSRGYHEAAVGANLQPWCPFHPSALFVPFAACHSSDIPRTSLSPWVDTETLYGSLMMGQPLDGTAPMPPPKLTYTPPACSESSTPPQIEARIETIGKSPSPAMVRTALHDKERACANCGKVAQKGSTFRKCAQCKAFAYCGIDCQKAHWKIHKKESVVLRPTFSLMPQTCPRVADARRLPNSKPFLPRRKGKNFIGRFLTIL